MNLNKFVNIGDRIEIVKSNKDKSTTAYSSKLVEIEGDEIIVEAPLSEGILVPLRVNDKFDIYFNSQKGIYLAEVQLKERINHKGVIPTQRFIVLSNIIKVQRREYFRLECLIDAKMRKLKDNEDIAIDNSDTTIKNFGTAFEDCLIKDISAGGIRINCMSELKKGDKIESLINLDSDIVNCMGKVVRTIKIADNNKYQVSINFIGLNNKDRECILRYILKQQRKLIKKGMM